MLLGAIRYGAEIARAATAHHLDPKLLAAVAAQETGGPGADSGNNIVGDGGHGRGLFQIDDRYWTFARSAAAMDPAKNADMAASILRDDLDRYGGDVRSALSAYNAGSPTATGTTTTWADGATLGYADSVLRHYDDLGGAVAADNPSTIESVNALSAYGGASAVPGFAGGLPGLAGSGFLPSVVPFTNTTAPGMFAQAATQTGAEADKAIAELMDSGDVFDTSAGDDG